MPVDTPPPSTYPSGPDVIVDFVFDRGMLFIAIENIGDKPAFEVRVKFSESIRGAEGTKDFSALPLFHNLEFLAPHKKITNFLDSSASYFRSKQPTKISAEIVFKESNGTQKSVTIRHNLEIYKDIVYAAPAEHPSPE